MKRHIQPDAPYREMAERIYNLRTAKGLSREQLGQMCGCTGRTISNYEYGMRRPTSGMALTLAAALGVTIEELLGTEPQQEMKHKNSARKTTARRMDAILDTIQELNAEGVLTREEIDDFADELNKILIHMRETAREKYIPRSKRGDAPSLWAVPNPSTTE